jgi:hypothetical protein
MTAAKEFIINQYLSVRLRKEETMIYIVGEPFIQCKFLLLNIPIAEISTFDEIESIDEAAEKLDEEAEWEIKKIRLPAEVEFWGHCSNLQVWAEHSYDTRLIHSNLAFPLLKRLTEVGDPLAKKIFKSEVMKRYENGTERTRCYLISEGFLDFLNYEEYLNLILNTDDYIAFTDLAKELRVDEVLVREFVKIEDRKVVELELWKLKLIEFPKTITDFKNLEVLSLRANNIKDIPEEIKKLNLLKSLWLVRNEISNLPDSICEMTSLEALWLSGNKIHTLPEKIGDLVHLKILRLGSNEITELPESFCNLKSLEDLSLSSNRIEKLPVSFYELVSLKRLDLSNNLLYKLPESLKHLESLEYLDVSRNPLAKNPKIVEELKKLKLKKIDLE